MFWIVFACIGLAYGISTAQVQNAKELVDCAGGATCNTRQWFTITEFCIVLFFTGLIHFLHGLRYWYNPTGDGYIATMRRIDVDVIVRQFIWFIILATSAFLVLGLGFTTRYV